MSQGGSDAYQTLPDPVLTERIALVFLAWSTNAYHLPDLGRNLPRGGFTNHYHRGLRLTIEQGIEASVMHRAPGWAGLTAWHSVENRESYQT